MIPEQCKTCKRLGLEVGSRHSCEAFPKGIPDDIYAGLFTHTIPHTGDHDLQYIGKAEEHSKKVEYKPITQDNDIQWHGR
jgi:hypothetical protein